ncbi:predicted protein [Sclerotinia sclerotiorum 1980 UF-70]|uniref:Uncharacterized protein n=1 Tax=Sclerotinia sclerotiorum (strain ATCC 18683 / 1980 / Ss-1) TaxID=665079 RepID=A7ECR0_SCLS1|nr:predicted protein [Sclerotinia sclerotiorum 1980 UF-70]EDO00239.1 predicted protein [Sclerotinia sclerotiorum 1980 UF-70]
MSTRPSTTTSDLTLEHAFSLQLVHALLINSKLVVLANAFQANTPTSQFQ